MSKKYKLLKDLPNAISGEIYSQTDDCKNYINLNAMNTWDVCYPAEYVEQNPSWFEEVKEERIEVQHFEPHRRNSSPNWYEIIVSKPIPEEKYSLIKEAIEKILNQ